MGVLPIRGAPVTGFDPCFQASGDILPSLVWTLYWREGSRAQVVGWGGEGFQLPEGKNLQEMVA